MGTAVGLSVLVSLISLLVPPGFVRGPISEIVIFLPLWVGTILAAHLLFSYPAARFLRKKIVEDSRWLRVAKGGVIGILLVLLSVDGFFCAGYILGIGDPRVGEAGQLLILYLGPVYLAEVCGAVVGAG